MRKLEKYAIIEYKWEAEEYVMEIRDKLIALRKRNGCSQEELAEKLGVSRQAVGRWETGTALPDAENLRNLGYVFGVSVDYLLNDRDPETDGKTQTETSRGPHKTGSRKSLLLLIASVSFALAAIAFLIAGIDRLDILFVVLSVICSALAAVAVYRFEKSKRE